MLHTLYLFLVSYLMVIYKFGTWYLTIVTYVRVIVILVRVKYFFTIMAVVN